MRVGVWVKNYWRGDSHGRPLLGLMLRGGGGNGQLLGVLFGFGLAIRWRLKSPRSGGEA